AKYGGGGAAPDTEKLRAELMLLVQESRALRASLEGVDDQPPDESPHKQQLQENAAAAAATGTTTTTKTR
ncbi:hypothetical protein HDU98_005367, partial [Podochytrium sp. JEL0797]